MINKFFWKIFWETKEYCTIRQGNNTYLRRKYLRNEWLKFMHTEKIILPIG